MACTARGPDKTYFLVPSCRLLTKANPYVMKYSYRPFGNIEGVDRMCALIPILSSWPMFSGDSRSLWILLICSFNTAIAYCDASPAASSILARINSGGTFGRTLIVLLNRLLRNFVFQRYLPKKHRAWGFDRLFHTGLRFHLGKPCSMENIERLCHICFRILAKRQETSASK